MNRAGFSRLSLSSRPINPAQHLVPGSHRHEDDAQDSPRLLIVEDNADLLHLTAMLLANEGFEVITAADAAEALDLLASQPVDAVFSDVVMPGMSGIELGEVIRQLYPKVAMVITSGYVGGANPTERQAFPLVPKPYHATTVAAIIYQQLARSRKQ